MSDYSQTPSIGAVRVGEVQARILTMKIIHFALLGGVLVFAGVIWLLIKDKMNYDLLAYTDTLFIAACVVTALGLGIASVLDKIVLHFTPASEDVMAALNEYQTLFLMRSAVLEGAAIFAAIATFVLCNILPACLLAACASGMVTWRPTHKEFMRVMKPGIPTAHLHELRRRGLT